MHIVWVQLEHQSINRHSLTQTHTLRRCALLSCCASLAALGEAAGRRCPAVLELNLGPAVLQVRLSKFLMEQQE